MWFFPLEAWSPAQLYIDGVRYLIMDGSSGNVSVSGIPLGVGETVSLPPLNNTLGAILVGE